MTKKYFIFLTVSLLALGINSCKTPEFESQYPTQEILIDGNDEDWDTVPSQKIESLSASLSILNDQEYLYLLIRIENPMISRLLQTRGISLSLIGEKAKSPELSIRYTGINSYRSDPDPNDSFWKSMTEDQKARFTQHIAEIKNMLVIGESSESIRIPSDGSQGPAAYIIFLPGFFGYEFKIPLEQEHNRLHALKSRAGETVTIEIKLGESESDESNVMRPSGFPGSRMGSSHGGDGFGMMSERKSFDKWNIRFKVILAN